MMAEFRFLGTWNDSWGILAAILETNDYSLVPDLLYDKPEPVFIGVLDERAKEMIMIKRNGFLWSWKYERYPPVMKRIEGGEAAGKYYVGLAEGGPYLRLSLPVCYKEGGVLILDFGELDYPKATCQNYSAGVPSVMFMIDRALSCFSGPEGSNTILVLVFRAE